MIEKGHSPVKLMQLLVKTQEAENYDHCEHGTKPRPSRNPETLEKSGRTLEMWYHKPQPGGHFEYWLHVCNVANPDLALKIYKETLLRYLPENPRPGAEEFCKFLRRFATEEIPIDELKKMELESRFSKIRLDIKKYRLLVYRTCRWALNLDESVSPVFCAPLLCQIFFIESLKAGKRNNYQNIGNEMWEWWKTLTIPEEWAGGHY